MGTHQKHLYKALLTSTRMYVNVEKEYKCFLLFFWGFFAENIAVTSVL